MSENQELIDNLEYRIFSMWTQTLTCGKCGRRHYSPTVDPTAAAKEFVFAGWTVDTEAQAVCPECAKEL